MCPGRTLNLWWSRWDSNPRPPRCHRGALPTAPRPHRIDSAMLAFARWPRPSQAANQLLSPHSKRLWEFHEFFKCRKKALIDGEFSHCVGQPTKSVYPCEYGEDLIEKNHHFLSR